MGSFVRDLRRSKEAVQALMDHYREDDIVVGELEGKENQKKGDFFFEAFGKKTNVEVKFDMYAKRSGNLCFEKSNGTKATGIMTTAADCIMYVVPSDDAYMVFVFDPKKLRDYIQNSPNITIKNGGDKKKFVLALAKMTDIMADKLPNKVFFI